MDEQQEEGGLKWLLNFQSVIIYIITAQPVPDHCCIYLAGLCYNMNSSVIPLDSFPSSFHIQLLDIIISQTYNRKIILLLFLNQYSSIDHNMQ